MYENMNYDTGNVHCMRCGSVIQRDDGPHECIDLPVLKRRRKRFLEDKTGGEVCNLRAWYPEVARELGKGH